MSSPLFFTLKKKKKKNAPVVLENKSRQESRQRLTAVQPQLLEPPCHLPLALPSELTQWLCAGIAYITGSPSDGTGRALD